MEKNNLKNLWIVKAFGTAFFAVSLLWVSSALWVMPVMAAATLVADNSTQTNGTTLNVNSEWTNSWTSDGTDITRYDIFLAGSTTIRLRVCSPAVGNTCVGAGQNNLISYNGNDYIDFVVSGASGLYTLDFGALGQDLTVANGGRMTFSITNVGGSSIAVGTNQNTSAPFSDANYLDAISQGNVRASSALYNGTYVSGAPTGSVYWAGVGTQYGQIGGQWSVPIYWSVCDSATQPNDLYADAADFDGENSPNQKTLIYDKTTFIGPQLCQGVAYLTGPVLATSPRSGTSTIRLFTTADGNIATSSEFAYNIGWAANGPNYLNIVDASPIYIPPTAATSSNLRYSYDATGLSWSGGDVCLYNLDAKTGGLYCQSVSANSGASALVVPNPSGDFYLDAKLQLRDASSTVLMESDPFMIVWYSRAKTPDLAGIFGQSVHDQVCSATDWADTNWWTQIRCKTAEMTLNLAQSIADAPKNMAQGTINSIKSIFPFNVPLQVYDSWNESASSTMPAGLSWLDPADGNGNIYIDMSDIGLMGAELGATSTPVWGPAVWGSDNKLTTLMGYLRTLSTYLIWFLLIGATITIGGEIYDDVAVEQVKKKHRDNDWQL